MYTILALGNPGNEYETTRHNAGQFVMKTVVDDWGWGDGFGSAKLSGKVFEGAVFKEPTRVVFPDTFMNHSGRAAQKLVSDSGLDRLLVIYDEVNLPFGSFKISFGRGDGGHNGLGSVIKELGSAEFIRVRVGIAPTNWFGRMVRPHGGKLSDYVLGLLSKREQAKLLSAAPSIREAIETWIKEGRDAAMNRFN